MSLIEGLLIGAALGVAKDQFIDKPKRQAALRYQAITAGLSPWTGIKPEMPENRSGDSIFQGAITGAEMGQQAQQAQAQQELLASQTATQGSQNSFLSQLLAGTPHSYSRSPSLYMPQSSFADLTRSKRAY